MTVYALVFFFASADAHIVVGFHGKPPVFTSARACMATRRLTMDRWAALGISVPDSVRCERIEIKGERDPRCDGPARYEANREAYTAGRLQPC